jgi:hypothetical protein
MIASGTRSGAGFGSGKRAEALEVGSRRDAGARRPGRWAGRRPAVLVVKPLEALGRGGGTRVLTRLDRWPRQGAMVGRDMVAHAGNPVGMPRLSECEQRMSRSDGRSLPTPKQGVAGRGPCRALELGASSPRIAAEDAHSQAGTPVPRATDPGAARGGAADPGSPTHVDRDASLPSLYRCTGTARDGVPWPSATPEAARDPGPRRPLGAALSRGRPSWRHEPGRSSLNATSGMEPCAPLPAASGRF